MIRQTFFKAKPSLNTPYRQLAFDTDDKGAWRVRLIAVENGRENADCVPVKSFDDGLRKYDEMYNALQREGWKPYVPQWTHAASY